MECCPSTFSPTSPDQVSAVRRGPRTVLLYERDRNRAVLDSQRVLMRLKSLLNSEGEGERGEKVGRSALRTRFVPKAHDEGLGALATTSASVSASAAHTVSPTWTVSTMTHDPLGSPCLLVQAVRDADVLITPHGFQSLLMLFQPTRSVFVEIFPFWFYRPFVYGSLQVALRAVGFHHRYYFQHESEKSFTMAALEFLIPPYNRDTCADEYVRTCGAVSRSQGVSVSDGFLERLAQFLRYQYYK